MAAPLPIAPHIATTISADTGITVDRADDGTVHQRDLYAVTLYTVRLQWETLSLADHDTLTAFLELHKTGEIDAAIRGKTFRGRLSGSPNISYANAQNLHKVDVEMIAYVAA